MKTAKWRIATSPDQMYRRWRKLHKKVKVQEKRLQAMERIIDEWRADS